VSDDPATDAGVNRRADVRRRRVGVAGHQVGADGASLARRGLEDADPRVRETALDALARLGALTVADVTDALAGGVVRVRRRAVDAALSVHGRGSRSLLPAAVERALADSDALVMVGAAWFLAERRHRPAVPALAEIARAHDDARCREAAVAALGAIGDPAGLPAVLHAAREDRPTVRRRAIVALAGFDDARVEAALRAAAEDRDWQVRQAAQELLDDPALNRPG
jgi:HEAT repeat protein